jgi:DNA end-binding protein Ku
MKRCAVGRWASKGKAHIVILRPIGDVLSMQQLHFAGEVRPATEVEVPKTEVKEKELKLARQLIEQQMSDKYDPTAYVDEVKGRIDAEIQKKVQGQEISLTEPEPAGKGKVIDLMEALRASLEKTEKARVTASKLGDRKSPKRVEEPAAAAPKARKSTRR